MLSTGLDALNERLGGLEPGRTYLVTGAPQSGKTTLALRFLKAGLERGEVCALLTQSSREELEALGARVGLDVAAAIEARMLVVLAYLPEFRQDYATPPDLSGAVRELEVHIGTVRPSRVVCDPVLPFLGEAQQKGEGICALLALIGRWTATTMLTLPGRLDDEFYRPVYPVLVETTGGVIHLQRREGSSPRAHLRNFSLPALASDTLDLGSGDERDPAATHLAGLSMRDAMRLLLVDAVAAVPDRVRETLRDHYTVETFESEAEASLPLLSESYGVALLAVDPHVPQAALDLVRRVRAGGGHSPIVLFSRKRGLRRETMRRAAVAGADDLLTDRDPLHDLLERIEIARTRGHAAPAGEERVTHVVPAQPRDAHGATLPLTPRAFRDLLATQQSRGPGSSFALVVLEPAGGEQSNWFESVSTRLRTREGDRLAVIPGVGLTIYLHEVTGSGVERLLRRLDRDSSFARGRSRVLVHPEQSTRIEEWVREIS